jgi:GH18 family chitinase
LRNKTLIKISTSAAGPQHNKTVVCYISTWAVYRPEKGSFNIDNFDPNLCTLAIYAFAGLDVQNDAIKSLGEYMCNILIMNKFPRVHFSLQIAIIDTSDVAFGRN